MHVVVQLKGENMKKYISGNPYDILESNSFETFYKKTSEFVENSMLKRILVTLVGQSMIFATAINSILSLLPNVGFKLILQYKINILDEILLNFRHDSDDKAIKEELIALILLHGNPYFWLSCMEENKFNDPFSAKLYKHFGKGIWDGIKSRKLSDVVMAFSFSNYLEESLKYEAILYENISTTLWVYLYHLKEYFMIDTNIYIDWLTAIGYKWLFSADGSLRYELLNISIPHEIEKVGGKKIGDILINFGEYLPFYSQKYPSINPDIINVFSSVYEIDEIKSWANNKKS